MPKTPSLSQLMEPPDTPGGFRASIIPALTNYAASGMILSGTFILFTPISSSDRVAPSLAPHGASDTLTSRGW